jgi:rhodanese-related sulfurtransferase
MTTRGDYGGDISPAEALELLKQNPEATLVDVRTQPEWSFVGVPDLSALGKEPVFLEWQSYPSMQVNEAFPDVLEAELQRRQVSPDAPVIFLCRSGARSRAAAIALTSHGRSRCLNIAGGFEGGPDPSRHRGMVEGWKATGLPWAQS